MYYKSTALKWIILLSRVSSPTFKPSWKPKFVVLDLMASYRYSHIELSPCKSASCEIPDCSVLYFAPGWIRSLWKMLHHIYNNGWPTAQAIRNKMGTDRKSWKSMSAESGLSAQHSKAECVTAPSHQTTSFVIRTRKSPTVNNSFGYKTGSGRVPRPQIVSIKSHENQANS